MEQQALQKYQFETGVYRPPSEGGSASLLIRVTRNCPWNKCAFCSMYKQEKFSLRSPSEVKQDIDVIAGICNDLKALSEKLGLQGTVNRDVIIALIEQAPVLNTHAGFVMVLNWLQSGGKTAFLQDANSLVMKTPNLVDILNYLRTTFPSLERVTSYARSKTLARKTNLELESIRQAGLDRLHVGLETGDDALLKRIRKGSSSEDQITGGKKAMAAGFQLSEYWMPGLAGKDGWETHAANTARVLTAINPHYIRSRPFFPTPGSPMFDQHEQGDIIMLSPAQQLEEIKRMVTELNVTSKVCFDHAANYWRDSRGRLLFSHGYEGYQFPEQKEALLERIEDGIRFQKKNPDAPGLHHFL
jgi:radical SAM superfamily enzyme YgiQ (UPF0313 family)